ncbi:MAG: hypothetical protein PHC48_06735 [Prevotella sp.]|nr:hypothetical protein [Prevotella sp.]MDD4534154.1 hypothetical protein [Prevotella sp.]
MTEEYIDDMTNQDEDLRQLFADYRPDLGSGDDYMQRFQRKLEAVEMVRQYVEAHQRRNRLTVVAALVLGVVLGSAVMAWVLLMPADTPIIALGSTAQWLVWIEQNSRLLTLIFLSLIVSLGIIGILTMRQDNMDASQKTLSAVHKNA